MFSISDQNEPEKLTPDLYPDQGTVHSANHLGTRQATSDIRIRFLAIDSLEKISQLEARQPRTLRWLSKEKNRMRGIVAPKNAD